ncbi:MAG: FlgD immunoglobulin-like domain containing protein [Polyangiaceae bacterium]
MGVDATSSLTGSSTATSTTGTGSSSLVGKDDFLKLLVAQLSHQDPTAASDPNQFVQQLSQMSTMEQAVNQSSQLSLISSQMGGLASNEAAGLIGKQVQVSGGSLAFDGTLATTSSVQLDGAATKVTAQIKDSSGNVVRTIDLGAQPQGPLSVTWDGKSDAGGTEPAGNYTVSVTATGADGSPVNVEGQVTGIVTKVSYDKGYPVVTLDSGATAPISKLVSVAAAPAK